MNDIKVEDVIRETNGKLIVGDENQICKRFKRDTREIEKGDTYIAFKGEHSDGNIYWREAFNAGADVVILQNIEISEEDLKEYKDKSVIVVSDTIKAIGQIAKYKRSLYNIPVVAITGSVGKTSTKDIIANVVSQKFKTLKTQGNFNNHIGMPLTLLQLEDHEAIVVEMGMNHFGEISYLTDIARPTIAVITNIGTSHIGNLGSRENILKAKLEILESMENKFLILNNDNDLLHEYYEKNKNKMEMKTFGINNNSNVMPKEIEKETEYSEFTYKDEKIKVPVGGEHFISNALAAISVGESLDIDTRKIKKGIETFELTKKRMEIVTLPNGAKLINDSYNASYESMKESIKYLAQTKGNRKIAVLGDMFELGEFSKELHAKVGEEVAKNKVDVLICIGELSKNIIEKAKEQGFENIYYFKDKEDAIKLLKNTILPTDIILLKASNGMKFFDIAKELIEFNEYKKV